MNNVKHAYVGQLTNTIDLEIEILVCGHCACWFGVDSGALECIDVALACPYCYETAEVEEDAVEMGFIESWDEMKSKLNEAENEIYNPLPTDNPPSHYDTPDDITEWEPIEGADIYENQALDDALREPIPDLYDDRGGEYE